MVVLLTVLFQSGLIGVLLYEDRRRRQAEARSLALSSELAHVNRVATAGELAASLAHEIRQPLAAIVARGGAGLNWLKRATPDLDKVRSARENIVENGHRADEVLRNTRAMFQKEETPQVRLNINTLIGEVLALTTRRLEARRIRLKTDLVDSVRANRMQLQQVLMNLIMNAIEAMGAVPRGDRLLTLRTEINDAGRVLVTVQDSGHRCRARAHRSNLQIVLYNEVTGMGLGLSICKSIVELYGGTLKAAPGLPVGMAFTIDLRLSRMRQGPWTTASRLRIHKARHPCRITAARDKGQIAFWGFLRDMPMPCRSSWRAAVRSPGSKDDRSMVRSRCTRYRFTASTRSFSVMDSATLIRADLSRRKTCTEPAPN